MSAWAALVLLAAVALLGAAAAALRAQRRRLDAVARAEHELRGPATALLLACERVARDPAASGHAAMLAAQLDRLVAGLTDLHAARTGRVPPNAGDQIDLDAYTRSTLAAWEDTVGASVDWRPGAKPLVADRGRLAQALGNLIANAVEHGAGEVRVEGRRAGAGVRVEVRNANPPAAARRRAPERGRGLAIAKRAVDELGGRLEVETGAKSTLAVLELPDREAPPQDRAA